MKIQKDTIVALMLKVADAQGRLIESSKEPMAVLIGGLRQHAAVVETALEGQEAGFATTLSLTPETGFGERDESKLRTIAKKDFPPGVKGRRPVGTARGRRRLPALQRRQDQGRHGDAGRQPSAGRPCT